MIDQARLEVLQAAMNGVHSLLEFEDRYAMVIDNLMDFERQLFNWTLIAIHRPIQGIGELFSHKRDANRLLGNLLSSCRQYIDLTHHQLGPFFDDTGITSQSVWSEQYDAHLSFRTMEALRNYVQHQALGIHVAGVDGA